MPALASVVFARLLAWALAALGSLPLLWLLPLSLPRISLCIRPRALIFETCSPARLHGHSLLRGASHEGCIPPPQARMTRLFGSVSLALGGRERSI